MAILYNITLGFEKASRIHFKTIYNAVMITISKYDDYTPSQKTILHYVLMNKNNIQKSIEMIETEIKPNEKHDAQEKKTRKKRTKKIKQTDLD